VRTHNFPDPLSHSLVLLPHPSGHAFVHHPPQRANARRVSSDCFRGQRPGFRGLVKGNLHARVRPSSLRRGSCELTRLLVGRFPARHEVPEFTTFASLLRMATKYDFSGIRKGLVEDLKGAYPTKWEDFETAKVLGEDVFGSPKPHPNAVLNLLLEQGVKFALPFAAYRAAMGGFSSLISDEPDMALPRRTLVSTVHGMGGMRRAMAYAAQTIAYTWDLGACPDQACVLNVGTNLTERRMEALKKIFDAIVRKSEGDILSSLAFGNLLCVGCARRLENSHRDCRRQFAWARLPSLLGWNSWEGIS